MFTSITRTFSSPRRSLAIVGALALAAYGGSAAVASSNGGGGAGAGTMSAHLQRTADQREARADYKNALAKALHHADAAERMDAIADAGETFWDDMTAAQDKYQARLDVVDMVGEAPYDPDLDPADFTSDITHPLLPFTVGTTMVYGADTEDGLEVISVTTLGETREIAGVECRVVRDTVTVDGEPVEDTHDYYAQDVDGNVWYFGETALNYEDGEIIDIDGSWWHGIDGAKAGILMPALPTVGAIYRQEFLLGEAEDMAQVLALSETVTVAHGTYAGCLQTREWTPIEPEVFEHKYYAPGLGLVLETNPDTGEMVELVDVIVQ